MPELVTVILFNTSDFPKVPKETWGPFLAADAIHLYVLVSMSVAIFENFWKSLTVIFWAGPPKTESKSGETKW